MIDKTATLHFQWHEQSSHTSNRKPHHAMSRWLERMRIVNPAGLVTGQSLFTEKEGGPVSQGSL